MSCSSSGELLKSVALQGPLVVLLVDGVYEGDDTCEERSERVRGENACLSSRKAHQNREMTRAAIGVAPNFF